MQARRTAWHHDRHAHPSSRTPASTFRGMAGSPAEAMRGHAARARQRLDGWAARPARDGVLAEPAGGQLDVAVLNTSTTRRPTAIVLRRPALAPVCRIRGVAPDLRPRGNAGDCLTGRCWTRAGIDPLPPGRHQLGRARSAACSPPIHPERLVQRRADQRLRHAALRRRGRLDDGPGGGA